MYFRLCCRQLFSLCSRGSGLRLMEALLPWLPMMLVPLLIVGMAILILHRLWHLKQLLLSHFVAIHKAFTVISTEMDGSTENVGLSICALTLAVEEVQKTLAEVQKIVAQTPPDSLQADTALGASGARSRCIPPGFPSQSSES